MHRGIFSQLFYFFFSSIAAAIIIIGSVHLFVSIGAYYADWKENTAFYARDALRYTETQMIKTADSGGDPSEAFTSVEEYYTVLSGRTKIEFMLTDDSGRVLAHSNGNSGIFGYSVPSEALSAFGDGGICLRSTLGGYYDDIMINVCYRTSCDGGSHYLFASLPTDNLNNYIRKLLLTFIIMSLLVMAAAIPLLNFAVMRIVRPIREMSVAARRFGEGDFSEKIQVYDQNELGYLASSMNDMADSLESIEEERKSFVSNVSHELKTPMTTIGGFVDGILDGTIPKESEKHYLRIVSEEIDRLARLVRSMLNLSKYESGEVGLQTEIFNASELIIRTVFLFEKRIESKHVDIEGLDMKEFYLNADIDLTQQVIYNLTENAVKFVNEGGTISFTAENRGEQTAIRIRNSGEGLKENEISKVFDKFYKTDESRGKDKTGVGLGLSIVRSIIKLHGGAVLVRSVPDEYTEFEFTMPSGTPPLGHI